MAFALSATVGGTTTQLNNGNPFRLLSATGLGGVSARRVVARGPTQHGDSDRGYRLQPREVELQIGFEAATDAALDAHRDTLSAIFRPQSSTPVYLTVTRDDSEVRRLDCYPVGSFTIALVPEHRPGHYHVATVRLRAADPAYYDPTAGSVTLTGSASLLTNWQVAGGNIPGSQVAMYGTAPAQGEAWSYVTMVQHYQADYTLAVRNAGTPAPGALNYLFSVGTVAGYSNYEPTLRHGTSNAYTLGTSNFAASKPGINLGTLAISPGTHNYFLTSRFAGFSVGGTTHYARYVSPGTVWAGTTVADTFRLYGSPRQWRVDWAPAIEKYALYIPALSETQREVLDAFMAGTVDPALLGTVNQIVPVAYEGNLPEYPVIRITGPINGPSITNTSTGDVLSFGTIAIGAGTTYVIDTRPSARSITVGTVSKINELSDDSDFGTWHLAPHPTAPGGTNVLSLAGSGVAGSTQIVVTYYNRYVSF